MSVTSFAELGLRPELLRAVEEAGYTTPTPIQMQAIPVILAGKDVMGGAQTGTGKTAGFALPILQKLAPMANTNHSPARHPVRALILTPTRELAVQVEESFRTYGKYTNLRSTVVYGGVDIKLQLPIVRGGVEILVATPGQVARPHRAQERVPGTGRDLRAGRGRPDARHGLHPGHQADHGALARDGEAPEPAVLGDVLRRNQEARRPVAECAAADRSRQAQHGGRNRSAKRLQGAAEAKRALLEHLVRSRNLNQVLCFMRTKHGASRLARQLEKDGLVTDAIHGDKSQQTRMEALEAFKEGKLQVLVATDVAARGLDIDDLPLVVNFELPYVPEDYIHRIGRTGRAGASGEAISFVAPEEEKYLADIERLLKKTVLIRSAEGFDPSSARGERAPRTARSDRRRAPGTAHPAASMRTPATRAPPSIHAACAGAAHPAEHSRAAPAAGRSADRARACVRAQPGPAGRSRRGPTRRRSQLGARAVRGTGGASRLWPRAAGAGTAAQAHVTEPEKI